MKIVNNHNLPELIFLFLQQDLYDHAEAAGTLSATKLIKPLQMTVLESRYWDQIEIDALDRIWSIYGSGIHAIQERLKAPDIEPLERLKTEFAGEIVSGKFDVIKGDTVYDYKVTKAWGIQHDKHTQDWRLQLSIYRWLFWRAKRRMLGDTGKIIAIIRDWDQRRVGKENYPKLPILEIPIKLLSLVETEQFVERKIALLNGALLLPDDQLPRCTDEERWYNAKTDEYKRCEKWCIVKDFCHQNKEGEHGKNVVVFRSQNSLGRIPASGDCGQSQSVGA